MHIVDSSSVLGCLACLVAYLHDVIAGVVAGIIPDVCSFGLEQEGMQMAQMYVGNE
jgi:hypothetical protein